MDFARKILGKYGWKDGDGLGKNNSGIAKPLRATLKFDTAGFGADQAASDFNNHWWERVFNEAASSVEVKKDGESIKMELKGDGDGVEISTNSFSLKKLKKAKESKSCHNKEEKAGNTYDNFLQAATLTNTGGEVDNPDRITTGSIEVATVNALTDEELFKACGGRTAHKGARHGLKLSGKLSRIEQQEKELLDRMMAKGNSVSEEKVTTNKLEHEKSKKRHETLNSNSSAEIVYYSEKDKEPIKSKKRKHTTEDSAENENCAQEELQHSGKRKKKKYKSERETESNKPALVGLDIGAIEGNESQSKTKKKKHRVIDATEKCNNVEEDTSLKIKKKKKKHAENMAATVSGDATSEHIKKRKKSKNNRKKQDE